MTTHASMPEAQPFGATLLARFRGWLDRSPLAFSIYGGLMAFGTYFAMYAYRKPFAAASFTEVGAAPAIFGVAIDYKVALVLAQVMGYALSKFIGIKVVSELPARYRALAILGLIGAAQLALVGFAYVPAPWNIAMLFLNGLPLGMIWGLIFGFIEGRRTTEVLGSILCASFIVASGAVKAVGKGLLLSGSATDFTMPMQTGFVFLPLLLVCVAGLASLPPPNPADVAARVKRVPMDGAARARITARYAAGLAALIALYVLLTALRDFRDNFSAEIWADAGLAGKAELFALSELPIAAVVLIAMALLGLVKSNRLAIVANIALIGFGLVVTGMASLAFSLHWIGPVAWMILLGGGLYLAYTPYNGALFDRLVAATGSAGTAGFFIYIADSCGYLGTVGLLLIKSFIGLALPWTAFLVAMSMGSAVAGIALLGFAAWYFNRKLAT
jgi:hypothetical protein